MKIKQLTQNGQTFVPQTVSEAVLVKVGDEVLTLKHLLNFGNPEQVLISTGGIPKWENQSSINAGKLGGLSVDELQLPAFAKFNIEDETITADTLQDSIKFTGTNIQISAQDKTINFAIPEMKDGVLGLVKGTNNTDLFLKGDGSWATPINTWRSIIVGNNQLRGDINTGSLSIEAGKNTQIDLSDNILTISSTDTNTEYQSGEGLTLGDDNTFILNTADANNIGGIQLGYESSKKNYAVQVDNRKAFVNVPWDVNLHVGSVDFKRKTTENGETYISVSEDGQFKNKYLIKGDGGTTVSSDSNGNITINSLPLHWTNLDGVPEDFIPSEHSHYTDQIIGLKGYVEIENDLYKDFTVALEDTLNEALHKIEYKSNLGTYAYNWYQSITAPDTDKLVNKWNEIVDFLNSISSTTDITEQFVTRNTSQEINGEKTFNKIAIFKKGFSTDSTDVVTNLNTEFLQGYHANKLFEDFTNSDPGKLSIKIGGKVIAISGLKAHSANYLLNGNAGNIVYQSAPGKTAFLENPSSGSVLKFNGEIPEWGLDYYRPIAVNDSVILGNNNNIFNLKQGSNITLNVEETDSNDYNVTISSYYHDTLYEAGIGLNLDTVNNTFNLQVAKSDSLGGIKVGYTPINTTTYAVKLDNNNAYVEVPVRTLLSIAKSTTNPLIELIEASSTINQYNIIGEGNTAVSSDENGNIKIYSPTTLDWKYIDNPPEFSLEGHTHITKNIVKISDSYIKSDSVESISTNDTLDQALGKLEFNANSSIKTITVSDNQLQITSGEASTKLTVPYATSSSTSDNSDTIDGYHIHVGSLPSQRNSNTIYFVI